MLADAVLDFDTEVDLAEWLTGRGWTFERLGRLQSAADTPDAETGITPHFRLVADGIRLTLCDGVTAELHEHTANERAEFSRLLDSVIARFRPDILITGDHDELAREAVAKAKGLDLASVVLVRDLRHRDPAPLADATAVLAPSGAVADYYRDAFGVACTVLPRLVDAERAKAERSGPGYVTFIDPIPANGVYAFARIASELGPKRPDIPLLVVEAKGTEATLAACGLDLRCHGNVNIMEPTPDHRRYWAAARICLLPSLGTDAGLSVAAEAMVNGVPIIGSDRGSLPETLGDAGVVLPLPERMTPATRLVPTPDEVIPWVEAVIRLWDDAREYAEHRDRALRGAGRWRPEILERAYSRLFAELRPGRNAPTKRPATRAKGVVLVPHLQGIDWECEQGLQGLERAGVRVVRSGGSSAIDVARNVLASDALHDGAESLLFIDSDIGFVPHDALRLLARPEPVVAAVYPKKGPRALTSHFAEGVTEVVFGRGATGLYPLRYAATGFLRIRAEVLRRMVEDLDLPLCNTQWGRGLWPFFLPLVVPQADGRLHYLGEDWAFSHRLRQVGVTPMADTSVRLWHYGRYGYGWEDAGTDPARYPTFLYRAEEPCPAVNPHRPPA